LTRLSLIYYLFITVPAMSFIPPGSAFAGKMDGSKATKKPPQATSAPNIPAKYDALFKTFDKGLMMTLDKFGFRMKAACDKLEAKVNHCEKRMKHCFKSLMSNTTRDLDRKFFAFL
jgi:hypothetical protein